MEIKIKFMYWLKKFVMFKRNVQFFDMGNFNQRISRSSIYIFEFIKNLFFFNLIIF